MKVLRQDVARILLQYPETRGNDFKLYVAYFTEKGLSTDLKDWQHTSRNIFESLSRARRKAQEENPYLLPEKHITKRRKQLQETFREEYRGL